MNRKGREIRPLESLALGEAVLCKLSRSLAHVMHEKEAVDGVF